MSKLSDYDDRETIPCPWCGEAKLIMPHPSNPGREIASCNCRGEIRSFFDRPAKKGRRKIQKEQASLPEQESEL